MTFQFEDIKNQRILLSFLNWGKGHLSRCIDVCRRLDAQGNILYVACSEEDFAILQSYVSSVNHISFSGYPFQFDGKGDFTSDLWNSRKALVRFITWEQKEVEKLVEEHQIDLIVSDHRYGFYSKKKPSVFITHQVNLALKWWQFPAQWLHHGWMNAFSSIWIMDDEQQPFAGKLSKKGKWKNAVYIGHFSRFENRDNQLKTKQIGVCNGPHPYNQQLLDRLIQNKELDAIISPIPNLDNRVVFSANWKETDELFHEAETIYSYCGYSTLMDLKRLNCKGKLIPTPGQTEQEYLFQLHQRSLIL